MSLNDFRHIVNVTVADFNCIAVENFVNLVALRNMWIFFVTYVDLGMVKKLGLYFH